MRKFVEIILGLTRRPTYLAMGPSGPTAHQLSKIELDVVAYEHLLGRNHPDVQRLRAAFEELKQPEDDSSNAE